MDLKKTFLFKDNNEVYIHIISSWYKQFGFDGNFEFMFFEVLSRVMQLHWIKLNSYMCKTLHPFIVKTYFKKRYIYNF